MRACEQRIPLRQLVIARASLFGKRFKIVQMGKTVCIARYKTGEPVYLRGVIFGRLLKLLLRVLAHGKPQLLADRGSKMVKSPERNKDEQPHAHAEHNPCQPAQKAPMLRENAHEGIQQPQNRQPRQKLPHGKRNSARHGADHAQRLSGKLRVKRKHQRRGVFCRQHQKCGQYKKDG